MKVENKKKVIIIDDDNAAIKGIKVELSGLEVLDVCKNSQVFFSKYKRYETKNDPNADTSGKVDIILIDIGFNNSDMDGFEILERLTNEDYNAIKVIITSRPIKFKDLLKSKKLGANGFVSKNILDNLPAFLKSLKIDEFKVEQNTFNEAMGTLLERSDSDMFEKFSLLQEVPKEPKIDLTEVAVFLNYLSTAQNKIGEQTAIEEFNKLLLLENIRNNSKYRQTVENVFQFSHDIEERKEEERLFWVLLYVALGKDTKTIVETVYNDEIEDYLTIHFRSVLKEIKENIERQEERNAKKEKENNKKKNKEKDIEKKFEKLLKQVLKEEDYKFLYESIERFTIKKYHEIEYKYQEFDKNPNNEEKLLEKYTPPYDNKVKKNTLPNKLTEIINKFDLEDEKINKKSVLEAFIKKYTKKS